MSIRAPIGRAGLSSLAEGKLALKQRTKRSLSQSLNLTAMVDFMSVIVIFLLMNFSASGDAMYNQPDIRLPTATVGEEVDRMPVISISASAISVEGIKVADSQKVLDSDGEIGLGTLEARLRSEMEAFKQIRAGEEFDGKVVIASDEQVPYKLVRLVFNVAAKTGYVRVNYVVRLAAKTKHE